LRSRPPRRGAPAATAPELTTTICRPAAVSAAMSAARPRIRSRRSPAAPARTLLPIFTTARRTRRRSRALWACWSIYCASHTWRLILASHTWRLGGRLERRVVCCCARHAHRVADDSDELARALAGRARDRVERDAACGEGRTDGGQPDARLGEVELPGDDDLRLCGERRARERPLAGGGVEVGERLAVRETRDVEQMHEDGRSREVTKKAGAEPMARVRALDQPGDVGEDEARVLIHPDDAEVRDEGRERIV